MNRVPQTFRRRRHNVCRAGRPGEKVSGRLAAAE